MRITYAYLVVIDISGYTSFITGRSLALEHAEQIISDLINAVLDRSRNPLILNKLEGDAALMYRELQPEDVDAARDVLGQVRSFFPAFHARAAQLREVRANCGCAACTNIASLALKAFAHVGEIAVKQIRQFEELAGEPIILLHRLMKNNVPSHEYVLLTSAAVRHALLDESNLRSHVEDVAGMGVQQLWIAAPESLPIPQATAEPGPVHSLPPRDRIYRHLSNAGGGLLHRFRAWLKRNG